MDDSFNSSIVESLSFADFLHDGIYLMLSFPANDRITKIHIHKDFESLVVLRDDGQSNVIYSSALFLKLKELKVS